ncbi:hypothetical protein nbrc107696_22500 [Gordonia spumicola]|uniref:3-oxoacyl-ACP reductase n=1 Tax=Gordonia spumicola TaxID=589161 RepID=A0A7I9V8C9_9ACTN|nr:hypothetical protein nbrc107696_20940 [Gordonia spumicola]GEE01804.1 hypothetical protein nbrc107696_22500 [Gordonia spumicola]
MDLDPAVAEAAERLGGIGVAADIASDRGRASVLAALDDAGEPPAVLVNNAGVTRDSLIAKMTEDGFRFVTRVNLGAQYELISALAERIVDGGAIVNISSRAQLGNVGQFNYAVSKGGVVGLTRAMALSLAPRLRVNAVAPGFIATAMTDAMPEQVRQRIIDKVPLGRAGDPGDIAATVAWLADGAASAYVTGQVVYCCGGRSFG